MLYVKYISIKLETKIRESSLDWTPVSRVKQGEMAMETKTVGPEMWEEKPEMPMCGIMKPKERMLLKDWRKWELKSMYIDTDVTEDLKK